MSHASPAMPLQSCPSYELALRALLHHGSVISGMVLCALPLVYPLSSFLARRKISRPGKKGTAMLTISIFFGLVGLLLAAGLAGSMYLRTHHALSTQPARPSSAAKQQSARLHAVLFS